MIQCKQSFCSRGYKRDCYGSYILFYFLGNAAFLTAWKPKAQLAYPPPCSHIENHSNETQLKNKNGRIDWMVFIHCPTGVEIDRQYRNGTHRVLIVSPSSYSVSYTSKYTKILIQGQHISYSNKLIFSILFTDFWQQSKMLSMFQSWLEQHK